MSASDLLSSALATGGVARYCARAINQPKGGTMARSITFPPKTQEQRKHRDIAVAWVTAQQPDRMFQSSNVTTDIARALRTEGYKVEQGLIKRSMETLVRGGYAIAEVRGRRTVLFMLDPDVEVPTPAFVLAREARQRNIDQQPQPKPKPAAEPGSAPVEVVTLRPRSRPPVPFQQGEPVWLPELTALVTGWWHADPEAATEWAEDVIRSLGEDRDA